MPGDPRPTTVVLSCEHAGNEIPPRYAPLFDSPEARRALASHRGWDPGAEDVARAFAGSLEAPLAIQRVSRLLVECNRSRGHPRLFSEFSRKLGALERADVVERFWRAHRRRVRSLVDAVPRDSVVVHVAVHTFTPVWKGRHRATEVGLLYDPRRALEAGLVRRWRTCLASDAPWTIHLNRPYRGWTDGLTTTLRAELPVDRYLGIELEISQALTRRRSRARDAGLRIAAGLRRALDDVFASG